MFLFEQFTILNVCVQTPSRTPYFSLKVAKIRKKQWQQKVYTLLRPRLLLVAITSANRPPGARLEIQKKLKLSLK